MLAFRYSSILGVKLALKAKGSDKSSRKSSRPLQPPESLLPATSNGYPQILVISLSRWETPSIRTPHCLGLERNAATRTRQRAFKRARCCRSCCGAANTGTADGSVLQDNTLRVGAESGCDAGVAGVDFRLSGGGTVRRGEGGESTSFHDGNDFADGRAGWVEALD